MNNWLGLLSVGFGLWNVFLCALFMIDVAFEGKAKDLALGLMCAGTAALLFTAGRFWL